MVSFNGCYILYMELSFKKWLEYAGQVTTTFSNQGENDVFAKKIRSKYIAGEPSKEELEDDISKRDVDKEFLGRRAPVVVYKRRKKYMKKDK